jgi:thiamine transporter ThiT
MIKNFKEFWQYVLQSILPAMIVSGMIIGIIDCVEDKCYDVAGFLIFMLSFMFSFICIVFASKINRLREQVHKLKESHKDIDWEFNKMIRELDKKYPEE